jgi:hypothetical protein
MFHVAETGMGESTHMIICRAQLPVSAGKSSAWCPQQEDRWLLASSASIKPAERSKRSKQIS